MSQFDWLIRAFSSTVFTVFDTETTGLDPKLNKVVEIGGIKFDVNGIISRFNVLIDPKIPMPPDVTKVNGITDKMLIGQPSASKVLPDFLRFIGDSVLLAHNAPFDLNFINEELLRSGLSVLKNRSIDTRIFAKEMFPALPKYSLQNLAVHFGIQAKDAHRAEDDARVCMELFQVCMEALRTKNPALVSEAARDIGQKETNTTQQEEKTSQKFETKSESAKEFIQDDSPEDEEEYPDELET